MITLTATADPSFLFLSLPGSGALFGYSVSAIGSAVLLTGANAYSGNATRTSVVRVRWVGGGFDLVACQPNC